jgi:chromosome segregation ATPase
VAGPNGFLCLKVVNTGLIIKAKMNDEPTQNLSGTQSFEERVFARLDAFDNRFNSVDARFDAVDARFNSVDARFDAVDARLEKLESRAYDTKPIWQRALKAIMETGLEVGEVKNKVNAIEKRVAGIENKVSVIETEVAGMRTDYGAIRDEFVDLKRELVRQLTRRLDLVLKTMVDHRDDLRDAEERITQLEAKLA